MMMKSSSSTLLCALVGLSVLLCVVNEAQGIKCYKKGYGEDQEEVEVDCSLESQADHTSCSSGYGDQTQTHPRDLCFKETSSKQKGDFKKCACSKGLSSDVEVGKCSGENTVKCYCNDKDLCNGTATPALAFSTLLSASALVIITSTLF